MSIKSRIDRLNGRRDAIAEMEYQKVWKREEDLATKGRRSKNQLEPLQDENGRRMEKGKGLEEHVKTYFQNFYTS